MVDESMVEENVLVWILQKENICSRGRGARATRSTRSEILPLKDAEKHVDFQWNLTETFRMFHIFYTGRF